VDSSWFYLEGETRRGPVDLSQLLVVLLATPDGQQLKIWREGMTGWTIAEEVPEIRAKLPPPNPSQTSPGSAVPSVTFSAIERAAGLYRRPIALVGVQLILWLFVGLPDNQNPSDAAIAVALAALLGVFGVFIGILITSYAWMKQLGSKSPLLLTIGMCIPLVNLLVLAAISSKAQAWFARSGVTVGFMGPKKASLERLRRGDA